MTHFLDELESSPIVKNAIKAINEPVITASLHVTKLSMEMECNVHVKKYVFPKENLTLLSTSIVNLSTRRDEYHLVLAVSHEVTGEQKTCPLAKGKANTYIQALDLLYDEFKSSPLAA